MADIFISYAEEDRSRVALLAAGLVRNGFSVWWDMRILPGRTWEEVVEAAIGEAKCVVSVWSRSSVNSKWVRREAAFARDRGVLVPVVLEDVTIPFAFGDIHAARLVGWSGDENDACFRDLCERSANELKRMPIVPSAFRVATEAPQLPPGSIP